MTPGTGAFRAKPVAALNVNGLYSAKRLPGTVPSTALSLPLFCEATSQSCAKYFQIHGNLVRISPYEVAEADRMVHVIG